MSNSFRLIVLQCVVLCGRAVYAQTSQQMTLGVDELFRLVDANSVSIKASQTETEAAREAVKAAKAQRLPDIGASLSFSYLGDGHLWDRDFSDGQSISMPHFGNNFSLQASQVVYSGGALSSAIDIAETGEKMAQARHELDRQDMRFLMLGNLLNLYKLDNQARVLRENIALTEMVIKNMTVRHSEGTVLHNDITRYELQKKTLELHLTKVQDAAEVINRNLTTTLHLSCEMRIVADTTLSERILMSPSEDEWQQTAVGNSLALRLSDLSVEMSQSKLRLERAAMLPKVAIVAEEHLDGPITIEVPTLDNNFNYWFVGVGVKYDISSLFKNNKKVRQARAMVRRAKEEHILATEQVSNAVHAALADYRTALSELTTQRKNSELADSNYSITSNRYANGLALLTDMLDAANTKLDAEMALVNARISTVYAYYKMKYITHTL